MNTVSVQSISMPKNFIMKQILPDKALRTFNFIWPYSYQVVFYFIRILFIQIKKLTKKYLPNKFISLDSKKQNIINLSKILSSFPTNSNLTFDLMNFGTIFCALVPQNNQAVILILCLTLVNEVIQYDEQNRGCEVANVSDCSYLIPLSFNFHIRN